MKKSAALYFCFIFTGFISAQNLDSLYNDFLKLKNPLSGGRPEISISNSEKYKCAFGLVSKVRLNYEKFSSAKKKCFSRVVFQTGY